MLLVLNGDDIIASLNMAFYDYDGCLHSFGVVSGYSDVGAVRMYVSTGTGTTYQYYSTEIYDRVTANINTIQNPTPCFVFKVRTDRDAESGYPTQLNYWVLDENEDGYGRYKVSFHFYNSSGRLLNTSPLYPSVDGYQNVYFQLHNSLDTPSISYDESRGVIHVSNVMKSTKYRVMVEIRRKNRNKINTAYSETIKDYAYTVLMKDLESGKYWEALPNTSMYGTIDAEGKPSTDTGNLCRYRSKWALGDGTEQTALVLFDSGANFSSSQRSSYLSIVKSSLQELTELTGITFKIDDLDYSEYDKYNYHDTIANMVTTYGAWQGNGINYNVIVRIGNNSTMYDETKGGDWIGQGLWDTYRWYNSPQYGLACSIANINIDASREFESISHVIHEEIYQSFGIGADNYEFINSIHADPEYCNPESYINEDADILRLIYSQDMCGWDSFDFINNIDTPCILFKECDGSSSYDFDINKLNADEYYAYAWIAGEKSNPGEVGTSTAKSDKNGGTSVFYYWDGGWDDSPYSNKSSISFTFKGGAKPEKWVWSFKSGDSVPMDSYGIHPVTASEWNRFTARVNEFREYAGYSAYSFTTVSSHQDLTPTIYNQAVNAIKGVSGYGTYLYAIENSTVAIQDSKFRIYLFDALASEANAIAGYT